MKEAHTKERIACPTANPTAKVSVMYDHQIKNDPARVPGSEPLGTRSGNRSKAKGENQSADCQGGVGVGPVADRLITAEELAPRIGFSVRKVWEYSRQGKLPTVRLNRRDIRFHWPTVLRKLNREN